MRILASSAGVLLATAGIALAQDVPTTIVAVPDTLIDFVVQIAFLVVNGILIVGLPILIAKAAERWGLQIEQSKRDGLQVVFTNAAAGLLQRLGERARDLRFDVGNEDVADAVNRALKSSPDYIKWAGLTEQEIARRILEKLPQIPTPAPEPAPAPTPISGDFR